MQLSDELLAAISTSPNGSKSLCRSPRDRGMSDDSARNFGEVKQTPPLFMQPVIRKAVSTQRHNVLMVTDFTFPKFGGVETHGYQLGQCLMERGHRVTFLTNQFQYDRAGVRYMANGMKVYHLPHLPVMAGDVAFVSFFNSFPLIREILEREQITIVHGHQSTSILMHIVLMAAKSLGIKTVFTEHSLYSFHDLFSIHLNKIIKWSFRDLDAAICVSHACKENFVLRAKIEPTNAFVVPNAVDSSRFTPDPSIRDREIAKSGNPDRINIVYVSRLAYRKGVDLLIGIIPQILAQFENVHFIIGGDGEGMVNLQKLVEKHNLAERVELLGSLKHEQVRDVLCRGHIFLNTSLTESFCIAILEAACCGLLVVSTDVGGVPEVLPPNMAYLAKPDEKSIIRQLGKAIRNVKDVPTETFYSQVASIYSWRQVAERTERVYDYVSNKPTANLLSRVKSAAAWGPNVGVWALVYTVIECFVLFLTELLYPAADIDIQHHFDKETYCEAPLAYGDHTVQIKDLARSHAKAPVDAKYSEEEGAPAFLHNEEVRVDMYSSLGDSPDVPKPFSRKRRYEMVKPNLSQIKHDLHGIKSSRKRRQ